MLRSARLKQQQNAGARIEIPVGRQNEEDALAGRQRFRCRGRCDVTATTDKMGDPAVNGAKVKPLLLTQVKRSIRSSNSTRLRCDRPCSQALPTVDRDRFFPGQAQSEDDDHVGPISESHDC